MSYRCRMSLCEMEFHTFYTCSANTGMVSAGCRWCWSCYLMISHMWSIEDRSGDFADQGNMSTHCRAHCITRAVWGWALSCWKTLPLNAVHEWQNYRLNYQADIQICSQCVQNNHESASAVTGNCFPDHDSRWRSRMFSLQIVYLQAFSWPFSDQYTAIIGTKTEKSLSSESTIDLHSILQWALAWHHWHHKQQWLGVNGMHATRCLARSCPSSNRFLTVFCVSVVPCSRTAAWMFAADS